MAQSEQPRLPGHFMKAPLSKNGPSQRRDVLQPLASSPRHVGRASVRRHALPDLGQALRPATVVLPMATTWQRRPHFVTSCCGIARSWRHCLRASKPSAMLCLGRFASPTKTRHQEHLRAINCTQILSCKQCRRPSPFCGRAAATARAAFLAEERP